MTPCGRVLNPSELTGQWKASRLATDGAKWRELKHGSIERTAYCRSNGAAGFSGRDAFGRSTARRCNLALMHRINELSTTRLFFTRGRMRNCPRLCIAFLGFEM